MTIEIDSRIDDITALVRGAKLANDVRDAETRSALLAMACNALDELHETKDEGVENLILVKDRDHAA